MKIGIDAKRIFFNNSGLGNYSRRFYRALACNFPEDRFNLYTPVPVPEDNPYRPEIIAENSRIINPARFSHRLFGGSLWRSGLVSRQLEKDQISIYYGLSNEIPFGSAKLKLTRVVIIHDLIFLRYPGLYPAADVFFYRKKTRYACHYADFIIAASEQTRNDIIEFYNVPGDKISVIYPGTDPAFYSEQVADPAEFYKPPRDYILSIGAITPRKNLLQTVMALGMVKNKTGLDLVVVGTAVGLGRKYLGGIMDFIRKNGLEERIHFLGNVPYKYLPGLCRNAKMLLYPSQFEGFGMPIVEGLFSRIPVITSKGGCFPEAGGDAAIYVNPNDTEEITSWIERLAASPALCNELAEKGVRYANKFRQEQIETSITAFHRKIRP